VGLILHWLLQVIGFHVMIGFPVNYVTLLKWQNIQLGVIIIELTQ